MNLEDNTWRRTAQTFAITPDTVLEFDFRSTDRGELHGIGFDENDTLTDDNRLFKVFGSQNWSFDIDWPDPYTTLGTTRHFVIPVGDYYTGSSMFLVLQNDDDASSNNNSWFSNVRIYEEGTDCSVEVDFEGGDSGWFNSGASTCRTGSFVIGTPSQQLVRSTITQVGGDHTSGSGYAFFSAVNSAAGTDDVDGGNCIVESPVYPVSVDSMISIWYFHGQRFDGNDPSGDFFSLELSTNGGTDWSPLATHGDSRQNASWTEATTSVTTGSNVKFRVQVSDGPASGDYIEAGVDDLEICSAD